MRSAESSISQSLLKGGVVTRHDSGPQEGAEVLGWGFPVCSLSGGRFAGLHLLPCPFPFSFPETQHDRTRAAILRLHGDKEEDG